MNSYLLYVPVASDLRDEVALVERAVLVKDGFSWLAFLAPPLWFVWRRCWVAGLGVLTIEAMLVALAAWLDVSPSHTFAALLALHVLAGLECAIIWGWTLRRRGFRFADAQVAGSLARAESALFQRFSAASPERPPLASPQRSVRLPSGSSVLGLFPEPEVSR